MKAMKLLLVGAMLAGGMQAKAGDCEYAQAVGLLMMFTVTSAPTGTSLMTSGGAGCSDLALNIKEDAVQYQMNGVKSELLQKALNASQELDSTRGLSESQVISKFAGVE